MRSMFDVFTTNADGAPQLVESVSCSEQAQELAHRLSCLFPGAYFGWFERNEDASQQKSRLEDGRVDASQPRVSSGAFLA